ncbi:TetR family transcriptional regulator [Blastococcus sp. TF02A-26]|uniref:TetR/AcrR family transcriptional regulator n=1 Tax=Blastococcus sp. TF02A-26 TaxID=2250577 RepID=UPI0018F4C2DA|nr:TetR family transcriptional regulator [Blastococcus sp. TF02A-26]
MTESGTVRRGPGRPPSSHAQRAIRAAAARLFARHGYSGTSVRDIAAGAGVDPALVNRHFGSKEGLFLATMSVDEDFRGLVDGPLGELGRAILTRVVTRMDGPGGGVFAALVGALALPEVRAHLARSTDEHVVGPLARRLSGPDADLRARLVGAQLHGLLFSLHVSPDPELAQRPRAEVLDAYARALQALIDDPTA